MTKLRTKKPHFEHKLKNNTSTIFLFLNKLFQEFHRWANPRVRRIHVPENII
jgi:hypothetical protein